MLDPCLEHLRRRVAAGGENALGLWPELRGMGCPGTASPVYLCRDRPSRVLGEPSVRSEVASDLTIWLAEARGCGVSAVVTFAAGREQDGAAVRAALTLPWSSGQAEGQITKLKLSERAMYGRASFDLLRRRVLLAA